MPQVYMYLSQAWANDVHRKFRRANGAEKRQAGKREHTEKPSFEFFSRHGPVADVQTTRRFPSDA